MGANCSEVEWAMACGVASLRSAVFDEETSGEEGKWSGGVAWVLKGALGRACVLSGALAGDWWRRAVAAEGGRNSSALVTRRNGGGRAVMACAARCPVGRTTTGARRHAP